MRFDNKCRTGKVIKQKKEEQTALPLRKGTK
jgi:hypothetical protein